MRHWKEKRVARMKRLLASDRFVFGSILNPGRSLIHIRSVYTTGPGEVARYIARECASTNELSARSMQRARNRRETRSSLAHLCASTCVHHFWPRPMNM